MALAGAQPTRAHFRGWSMGWTGGIRPPLLIWLPTALVVVAMLLPVAYLVLRSSGAGAEALQFVLSARAAQLLLQTALLALTVTAAATLIGVPIAWLTTRSDLPLRRLWSVLLVLPLVIPTYVGAFTYVAALGPRGLLQQALAQPFGVERLPEIYGFSGAALVLTLFTYPYVVLTVRGALLRLDPSLEHASRSLGHGTWSTFLRITLPLLRPGIAAGGLLVALYTLSDFGAVSLLQFDAFTRVIYLQYQGSLDRTMAAVLALLLVLLTAVVIGVEVATRGRARYYRTAAGSAGGASTVRLGRMKLPATLFCGMVFLTAVALPCGVLIYWLARGLVAGSAFALAATATIGSLSAASLAALATLAAAIPVSVLIVRYGGRPAAVVERVTYAAFALPGIIVALALVFFAANYAPTIYQTLGLLVAGYVIRFLPEAVGSLRSALLFVSPRLEEAARSLGRRPHQVLATVTIPLIAPGALAGTALVFMSSLKELPVTLLLSPIGFKTLATASWSAATEGLFAQAALPALILVLASAFTLPFMLRETTPISDTDA